MTEARIEQQAERMMDALDRRYLGSNMSLGVYEAEVAAINRWVELQQTYRIIGQRLAREA